MKIIDPYILKSALTESSIWFSSVSEQGQDSSQDEYCIHYLDECFTISDGISGSVHSQIASHLAGDTALWGYRLIRQRKFYWQDKKMLIKRIFRSANITVWQKQRETGFEDGLPAVLTVAMIGAQNFWMGSVGNCVTYLIRSGKVIHRTNNDILDKNCQKKTIGTFRFGLVPRVYVNHFDSGDILIMTTDGINNVLNEGDFLNIISKYSLGIDNLDLINHEILSLAKMRGSNRNMSVTTIERRPKF